MDMHIENYKGIFHMAVFLAVLIKVHMIDRKLSVLEKRTSK